MAKPGDKEYAAREAAQSIALMAEAKPRLLNALRLGNYRDTSCRLAGINKVTFWRWMIRGKSDAATEAPYREFRQAVLEAEAAGEAAMMGEIYKAGKKDARHLEWILTHGPRKHKFAEAQQLELTGKGGGPVGVAVSVDAATIEEELQKALQAIKVAKVLGVAIPIPAPALPPAKEPDGKGD